MNMKIKATLLALSVTGLLAANGCQQISNAVNSVCCTNPDEVAKNIADVKIRGNFQSFLGAADALTSVSDASVADVSNACAQIALDLGATAAELATAESGDTPAVKVNALCTLASNKITSSLNGASISVLFAPPKCEASVNANAQCEARCSVDAKCDVKVNPPTCTGGELEVECKGNCAIQPGKVDMECQGSCTGECQGSCTANVGASVECDGTCEGTCAAGGAAGGSGIQADGTCKGTCKGTCQMRAGAKVSCSGTCSGRCDASCNISGTAPSVKCSGSCSADYTPLSCKGGELKGGCNVDAECKGNCSATVQAQASCTEPRLDISTTAPQALIDTLQVNLPKILVILEARGKQIANLGSTIANASASASANFPESAVGCVVVYATRVGQSAEDFAAALSSGAKVTAAVSITSN